MKLTPKTTGAFMTLAILACLVYEGLALAYGNNATISEWVWSTSRNPFFIFMCGVLAGHFFFLKSSCVWCGRFPYRKSDANE